MLYTFVQSDYRKEKATMKHIAIIRMNPQTHHSSLSVVI